MDLQNTFAQLPELRTEVPRPRPRVWTAIVLPAVSLAMFIVASGLMIVAAFYVVHGEIDRRMMVSSEGMKSVSLSRIGLLLLVVAPQLALVIPAVLAAMLSPVPTAKRLSLVRGHWPLWAWVAAAAVTPLVGWISSLVVGAMMQESENLKMMTEVFRAHGKNGFLIPLALIIGATPALCEELLFRGYVQTRLNRSFGPLTAILFSSLLFAVFHMDLVHIVAVFPLGVFLGFVAWRSGSLFPAMLAHFFNNAVSVISVVLSPEGSTDAVSPTLEPFLLSVLVAGFAGALGVAWVTWRIPMPPETTPQEIEFDAPEDPLVAV